MKRIINGVTYNTATSTALARSSWDGNRGRITGTLYQTRGGAFFVHGEEKFERWNEREDKAEEVTEHWFDPLGPEGAHEWIMEGEVEVFHNPFDDPPEAAEEAEPGATIYIRVPASLKQRVEEAAREAKLSGNVWSMRCVERCLEQKSLYDYPDLVLIWTVATEFRDHANDGQWSRDKCIEALTRVARYAEGLAKRLGVNLEDWRPDENLEIEELRREFSAYGN